MQVINNIYWFIYLFFLSCSMYSTYNVWLCMLFDCKYCPTHIYILESASIFSVFRFLNCIINRNVPQISKPCANAVCGPLSIFWICFLVKPPLRRPPPRGSRFHYSLTVTPLTANTTHKFARSLAAVKKTGFQIKKKHRNVSFTLPL